MNTQEILTIIAMAALGLCLVLAFSKGLTKNLKTKESITHVCSLLVVIAVALLAVTQFLSDKKENMEWEIGSVATASRPNVGKAKKGGKKASMGQMGSGSPCTTTVACNGCGNGYCGNPDAGESCTTSASCDGGICIDCDNSTGCDGAFCPGE
jgi:hypothetical protein